MKAVLLCAGYATRLYPLTLDRPKPLLEVAGKAIIDHILDKLADAGVGEAYVVTNHKFAPDFERWAGARPVGGGAVRVLDDQTTSNDDRLGSIGDLVFALNRAGVDDDFVLINGDNLFTFALGPLVDGFRRRGNTIGLYDVGSIELAKLFGVPRLDAEGRVVGFVEKPADPWSSCVSIGIYVYGRDTVPLVGKYLSAGHSPDKTGQFVEWLYQQTPVFGHVISHEEGVWFDIGSHDQLEEARKVLARRS